MRSSSSSSASEFEDLQWHCQEQAAARDALAVELQQTKVAQAQVGGSGGG
jgi:hypothetical protein